MERPGRRSHSTSPTRPTSPRIRPRAREKTPVAVRTTRGPPPRRPATHPGRTRWPGRCRPSRQRAAARRPGGAPGQPEVGRAPVGGGRAQDELAERAPAVREVVQGAEEAQDGVGLDVASGIDFRVTVGTQRQVGGVAQHQGADRHVLGPGAGRVIVGREPSKGSLRVRRPDLGLPGRRGRGRLAPWPESANAGRGD